MSPIMHAVGQERLEQLRPRNQEASPVIPIDAIIRLSIVINSLTKQYRKANEEKRKGLKELITMLR